MGARIRFLTVRQSAALAVAVLAIDAVLSGIARDVRSRQPLFGHLTAPGFPSQTHVLSVIIGLALLALTPRLWRGTRTAVPLAIAGLATLAALSMVKGHIEQAAVNAACACCWPLARSSFPLGCRNRPRLAVVGAALGAWGLAYCALRVAPLVPAHPGHVLERELRHSVAHALRLSAARPGLSEDWTSLIEGLIGCAALISVLAMRSLLRPAPSANGHVQHEYLAARAIVERYGEDSLSPFVLRPDKALQFAAGGVLSYRVIRGTAIVSSDPVAPDGAAGEVLSSFLALARRRGWQVGLWGASARHLAAYRELGLRAICVGEEAFVDPRRFTLEGRAVRKLRQSVHRVQRRGWEVTVHEGRSIDAALESEIDELEWAWRARQPRMYGFAMGMGVYDAARGAGRSLRPRARPRRASCARACASSDIAESCPSTPCAGSARRRTASTRRWCAGRLRSRASAASRRSASTTRGSATWSAASRAGTRLRAFVGLVMTPLPPLPDGTPGALQREVLAGVAAALPGLRDADGAAPDGAAGAPGRGLPPRAAPAELPPGRRWTHRRWRARPTPGARGSGSPLASPCASPFTSGPPGSRRGPAPGAAARLGDERVAGGTGAGRDRAVGRLQLLGGLLPAPRLCHVAFVAGARPGRLVTVNFCSRRSGREADYVVYLPPGYDPAHRRYPVSTSCTAAPAGRRCSSRSPTWMSGWTT